MQEKKSYFLSTLEWLTPSLPISEAFKDKVFSTSIGWHLSIALMLNLLSLAIPLTMLQVYDRIIPHKAFGTLTMLIIGVGIALTFEFLLRIARAYLTGCTAAAHEHAHSCDAVNRIINSNLIEFEKTSTGQHMQNMTAFSKLREFYSGQALTTLIDVPFILIFLGLIAYLAGWLVLVPILILSIFTFISHYIGLYLKFFLEQRSATEDNKYSFVISVLNGIHTVKTMSMESRLIRSFEGYQEKTTQSSYQVAKASAFANVMSTVIGQASLILTVTVGCALVMGGYLTIGGLSASTLLAGRALQPAQRILGLWLKMQDFNISRTKVTSLLNIPTQIRKNVDLPLNEGRVVLQNVSFSYNAANFNLFKNIDLIIEPGEVIALTGNEGCGKSTLLQLIAGVLIPDSGKIEINGITPSHFNLSQLHKHIGYLPKNGVILKGTILENITGFQSDEESIMSAKKVSRALGVEAAINQLPKGYDTLLLDSPADPIAPGIKQRVALTRVIKNNPSILIFDNADRTLDKEGYNLLFRMIGRLKGKTTLIISSYDQNLISFANRIYGISDGILKELPTSSNNNLAILESIRI